MRTDVLSRTVADLSARVRWVLLAERGAERDGLLQRVAPGVKLAGTVALVVVAPQAALLPGPSLWGTPLTTTGTTYVLVFVTRVAAAATLLTVLVLTTRVSALLAGARRLRVPRTAVVLVGVTYRYLLVFFGELGRMTGARRARTRREPTLRETWRDSGAFLSTFLVRTIERSERVGRAARARGGGGVGGYDRTTALTRADAAFGAVVVTVAATAVVLA